MTTGSEWLVDASGCDPELLRDLEAVRQVCNRLVVDLDLHVVGKPIWHEFPWPGGVTGLYLLSESHLACHTYPEAGVATFNLYCCRSRPVWPWRDHLRDMLGAAEVWVRCVVRGEAEHQPGRHQEEAGLHAGETTWVEGGPLP